MEKYWGWSEFRPGQKEAISASISGKNTLVLLVGVGILFGKET